jgi:D-ribose pyranase
MKKTQLIHPEISEMIASLGHSDMLVIADAGLPIPPEVRRIDLALTANVPRFGKTLEVILSEMQVERVILAQETKEKSPQIREAILNMLPGIREEIVSHEELKQLCSHARAVVRTGEFTPYANVILVAGVVF